jgi:hypothetical protein
MTKLNLRNPTKNKPILEEVLSTSVPFEIGKIYIFRTTTMCDIGKVNRIIGNFIEFDDSAVWVANAQNWKDLLDNNLNDCVIFKFKAFSGVNINSIVDYVEWKWNIPDGI